MSNLSSINYIGDKYFFIHYGQDVDISKNLAHHYHNYYELNYLVCGERYYFVKDRSYHLMPGDLVIIDANKLHKPVSTIDSNYKRILIHFDKRLLQSFNNDIQDIDIFSVFKTDNEVITLEPEHRNIMLHHSQRMINEYNNGLPGFMTTINILLIALLIYLHRNYGSMNIKSLESSSYMQKTISEIAQYINLNYREQLDLTSVAGKFSMNPYYLSRVFKEVTGFTFLEYIHSLRIAKAERLLKQSKNNITQICRMVGYNNITHMGRVFKSINGCSPSEYRKQNI